MLINILQHQIPQIESLENAIDFEQLHSRLVVLAQSITGYAAAQYAAEISALTSLANQTLHLKTKQKSQNDFSKAKARALLILNAILEMED
jgi:hypothetical protein